jgi:OOP family OmpA-OmpF porin
MSSSPSDLIQSVLGYLNPDLVRKAASFVGETPDATQKALTAIAPTGLAALASFGSSESGAGRLLGLLNQGSFGSLLDNVGSLFGGGSATQQAVSTGRSLLESVLGGKLGDIAGAIGNASGIKSGSATSLMSLAMPLIMGVLGKQVTSRGLDASGLSRVLSGLLPSLVGMLPAGVGSLLGITGPRVAEPSRPIAAEPVRRRSPWAWLLPLLLLGLLLIYLLGRGRGRPTETVSQITLPGGTVLSLPEGSFHLTLARYLGDTAETTVPRTFVFDNLNFDSAQTTVTPESRRTVDDLIVILKAYPSAEMRLEGHTDNTGDAEANRRLSQGRADAVKELLVAGGIDGARIGTAGVGQDRPVASNDTEEGRARNRRTELVVTRK